MANWSAEAVEYLLDNYNKKSVGEIAEHLNFEIKRVENKIGELELGKESKWDISKYKYLIANYKHMEIEQLSNVLGINKDEIVRKASKLMIVKYSRKEINHHAYDNDITNRKYFKSILDNCLDIDKATIEYKKAETEMFKRNIEALEFLGNGYKDRVDKVINKFRQKMSLEDVVIKKRGIASILDGIIKRNDILLLESYIHTIENINVKDTKYSIYNDFYKSLLLLNGELIEKQIINYKVVDSGWVISRKFLGYLDISERVELVIGGRVKEFIKVLEFYKGFHIKNKIAVCKDYRIYSTDRVNRVREINNICKMVEETENNCDKPKSVREILKIVKREYSIKTGIVSPNTRELKEYAKSLNDYYREMIEEDDLRKKKKTYEYMDKKKNINKNNKVLMDKNVEKIKSLIEDSLGVYFSLDSKEIKNHKSFDVIYSNIDTGYVINKSNIGIKNIDIIERILESKGKDLEWLIKGYMLNMNKGKTVETCMGRAFRDLGIKIALKAKNLSDSALMTIWYGVDRFF